MQRIALAGTCVLLVNLEGTIRAFVDRCPHRGFPLSRGTLAGSRLTCAAHSWSFDLAGGGAGINPSSAQLVPLTLHRQDDVLYVELPDE